MQLSDRSIAVGVAASTLGLAVWLPHGDLMLTRDDGFYYLKIAQSVALGEGSTFDGLHSTNGYHPLWLLLLVPVFWIADTPAMALQLAEALQTGLVLGASVLLYHLLRRSVARSAALFGVGAWILFSFPTWLTGMETSLYALGLIGTMYVFQRWFSDDHASLKVSIGLGVLLSLLFLTRLDTIQLAAILLCFLGVRVTSARHLSRLLWCAAPLLVSVVIYVVVNLFLFGHPFPISGVVKRMWSTTFVLPQDPIYVNHGWIVAKIYHFFWPLRHLGDRTLLPIALALGLGCLWLLWLASSRHTAWHRRWGEILRPWHPFILFSLLSYTTFVVTYHGGLSFTVWYHVVQPCLVAATVAIVFDQLNKLVLVLSNRERGRAGRLWRASTYAFVLVWLAFMLFVPYSVHRWRSMLRAGVFGPPWSQHVEWIKANVPSNAVVGAWNAGTIGFLTGRRVVNLDGLVNSWDYLERRRHNLCEYWDEVGITYIVDFFGDVLGQHQGLSETPTYPYYAHCQDRLEKLWSREPAPPIRWPSEAYILRARDE